MLSTQIYNITAQKLRDRHLYKNKAGYAFWIKVEGGMKYASFDI